MLHPERVNCTKACIPFLFVNPETAPDGSTFEVFYTDPTDVKDHVWNYGFVLNDKGVQEEWLNTKAKTVSKKAPAKIIFHREGADIWNRFESV